MLWMLCFILVSYILYIQMPGTRGKRACIQTSLPWIQSLFRGVSILGHESCSFYRKFSSIEQETGKKCKNNEAPSWILSGGPGLLKIYAIELGNKGPRTMGSLNCNNADHRKFLLKSQMHLNCKLGFLLVDEVFVLQPDVDIRGEQDTSCHCIVAMWQQETCLGPAPCIQQGTWQSQHQL